MRLLFFMPASRLLVCLGPLLLLQSIASAQNSEAPPAPFTVLPPDDFTQREVIAQRTVLPYAPVRESDILWEKRLWRVIDLREKMNLPFRYPEAPLAQLLGEAALNGDLTVFDPADDKFTKTLDAEGLMKSLYKTDTIVTYDVTTGLETIKIVRNAPDWAGVQRFRLKEAWFFDTRAGALRFRILGIAPLINVTNEQGDFLYERPLFWVHYPTTREFLARQKVYAPGGNLAATLTWEDLFEMRHFAASVYKESNPYDRRIEDYLAGSDKLYESARIDDALFNREHDVWSW